MIKLLIAFAIFAGVVYYYNIDLIGLVDKSGVPAWLERHGYVVHKAATSTDPTVSSESSRSQGPTVQQ